MKPQRPTNGIRLEKIIQEGIVERVRSNDFLDPIDKNGGISNLKVRFFIALYQCIEKDLELIRVCGLLCEQSVPLEEIETQSGLPTSQIKEIAELSNYLFLPTEALEADYVGVWYRYLRCLLTPNGYTFKDRKGDLRLLKTTLSSRRKLRRRIRDLEERLHHVTSMMVNLAQKKNE